MNTDRPSPSAVEIPRSGRFVASQALIWCVAAALAGAAVARAAVWAEHVNKLRAPLLIFPIVVGCGLGLLLAAVMRLANIGHRPTLLVGAVLAAIVAATGQHYVYYREYLDARAAFLAEKRDDAALAQFQAMAPLATPGFVEYLRAQARLGRTVTTDYSLRGAAAWASWALDGLLLMAAAVAVVYAFSRSPYCQACHSWYRPVRAGRVDSDTALRLVEAAAIRIDHPIVAARYRLSHCASGCGPARLQLACDDGRGSTHGCEAWLPAAGREGVTKVLDSASVGWDKRASASEGPT
jgi:hypothetical protein